MKIFGKNKIIKFFPDSKETEAIIKSPDPSVRHLPDAYKKLPRKIYKNFEHILPNLKNTNFTLKACVPFFDAMTAGYMITLPCDVVATKNPEYNYRLFWDVSWDVVTMHSSRQYGDMSIPDGFEPDPYKWEGKWIIKTPPGYSLLFIHPINRHDLPFLTLTGLVDSDMYTSLPVNLPFLLKENFEGVIKKGTPIAQIIPIKREEWKSKTLLYNPKTEFAIDDLKSVVQYSYKNRFWEKKKYD